MGADRLLHRAVQRVGERGVPEIVQQSTDLEELRGLGVELQLRGEPARDVTYAERVLEPGVVRAREDEVGASGLTDPPQPLERRMSDELQRRARETHGA